MPLRFKIKGMTSRDSRTSIPRPLRSGCDDTWSWNRKDKSHEVRLCGVWLRTAQFHPNWSNGTAGVRGSRVLNSGKYYWEVNVSERIFGTSMMFGIGTKKARLHVDAFINMLGEDDQGWGLSHKGILWHNGEWRKFTKPFRENEATTVGLLFDGPQGTLTYFKDGVCLGVAFSGLHLVDDDLYPVVCSTAAKTEMTLSHMRRDFYNLQDRCRAVILNILKTRNDVNDLNLPTRIKSYLMETKECQQVVRTRQRDTHSSPYIKALPCNMFHLPGVKNSFLYA
ncbi:SPRY domain-containing SOCS box protein 3-like [Limulus polyphemus]|uniref:SPRY domain-containing SOCS box protein 3 n=1 Tax=Limulus polyphemus TaxID=6850 RepID=A0ABM1C4G5_LIMPO|nr:SPRY domain-containing SOCS box protein 3-like [Limulus polyphemus]